MEKTSINKIFDVLDALKIKGFNNELVLKNTLPHKLLIEILDEYHNLNTLLSKVVIRNKKKKIYMLRHLNYDIKELLNTLSSKLKEYEKFYIDKDDDIRYIKIINKAINSYIEEIKQNICFISSYEMLFY